MIKIQLRDKVHSAVANAAKWQEEKGEGRMEAASAKLYFDEVQKHLSGVISPLGDLWATRVQLLDQDDLSGDPIVVTGKLRDGIFGVSDDAMFVSHDVGMFSTHTCAFSYTDTMLESIDVTKSGSDVAGIRILCNGHPYIALRIYPIPGVGARRRTYRDMLLRSAAERSMAPTPPPDATEHGGATASATAETQLSQQSHESTGHPATVNVSASDDRRVCRRLNCGWRGVVTSVERCEHCGHPTVPSAEFRDALFRSPGVFL